MRSTRPGGLPGLAKYRQLAVDAARTFRRRMRDLGFDPAGAVAVVRHEAELPIEPGWAPQP